MGYSNICLQSQYARWSVISRVGRDQQRRHWLHRSELSLAERASALHPQEEGFTDPVHWYHHDSSTVVVSPPVRLSQTTLGEDAYIMVSAEDVSPFDFLPVEAF